MGARKATLTLLGLALATLAQGQTRPPNCTEACPTFGAECWDTTMENGACDDIKCDLLTQFHPAEDCSTGCWRLKGAVLAGKESRSHNDHHVYTRMRWANGSYITSGPQGPFWTVYWGDNWHGAGGGSEDKLTAKGGHNWGNYPMYGGPHAWFPCTSHKTGPYGSFAGQDRTKSDIIYGMGLPVHHHYCWYLVWEFEHNAPPTPPVPAPIPVPVPVPVPAPVSPIAPPTPVGPPCTHPMCGVCVKPGLKSWGHIYDGHLHCRTDSGKAKYCFCNDHPNSGLFYCCPNGTLADGQKQEETDWNQLLNIVP